MSTSPLVLDAAGTILPDGLRFFTPVWWVIHLLAQRRYADAHA